MARKAPDLFVADGPGAHPVRNDVEAGGVDPCRDAVVGGGLGGHDDGARLGDDALQGAAEVGVAAWGEVLRCAQEGQVVHSDDQWQRGGGQGPGGGVNELGAGQDGLGPRQPQAVPGLVQGGARQVGGAHRHQWQADLPGRGSPLMMGGDSGHGHPPGAQGLGELDDVGARAPGTGCHSCSTTRPTRGPRGRADGREPLALEDLEVVVREAGEEEGAGECAGRE